MTTPARLLFPFIQYLVGTPAGLLVARVEFCLDVCPPPRPASPATVVKVGIIGSRLAYVRHQGLPPAFMAALHHHVALGEILQNFHKPFPAIECRCDLVAVRARKLKEDVRPDG